MKYDRSKKLTKYERIAKNKEFLENAQKGFGKYIYKNISKGELTLPKPAIRVNNSKNLNKVPVNETWEGDNYYKCLIYTHEAALVKEIMSPEEERKNMEKLILDQPDQVTVKGTVEHVVIEPTKLVLKKKNLKMNEVAPVEKPELQQDVLILEDPLAGVEILFS